MNLTTQDLTELADIAIRAATEAGQMVARTRPQNVEHKASGATLASQVVTEIDRAAEEIIVDILNPTLEPYELGLLTEETPDDGGRLTADYFWSIAPIDGTLPFIEGNPGYSISIALVRRDATPQIGVVYDPVEETLYHAVAEGGLFRDRQPWEPLAQPRADELSVFVTGGFLAIENHDEFEAALGQAAREMGLTGARLEVGGGAVMKACAVLDSAPACFFIFPGPTGASLWDYAATACLFAEANAIATDMSGGALDLNRADSTNMGHRGALYASEEEVAQRVRQLSNMTA